MVRDETKRKSFIFFLFFSSILDDVEDEEILSSSTVGRLWKASFGRRGIQNFLDICLLKKAYTKALDGIDTECTTNENTTAEQTSDNTENQDELDYAARLGKRVVMGENEEEQQTKRLRSNSDSMLL